MLSVNCPPVFKCDWFEVEQLNIFEEPFGVEDFEWSGWLVRGRRTNFTNNFGAMKYRDAFAGSQGVDELFGFGSKFGGGDVVHGCVL